MLTIGLEVSWKGNKMNDNGFKQTICIDLDCTLTDFVDDLSQIGELLPGAKESLSILKSLDYRIVIHTSRSRDQKEMIKRYFSEKGIEIDGVNCSFDSWSAAKPLAIIYIDDRGYHFKNWKDDMPDILEAITNNMKRSKVIERKEGVR